MSHTAEQIRGDILMVRNKSPSKAIISLCKKQNKLYERCSFHLKWLIISKKP